MGWMAKHKKYNIMQSGCKENSFEQNENGTK